MRISLDKFFGLASSISPVLDVTSSASSPLSCHVAVRVIFPPRTPHRSLTLHFCRPAGASLANHTSDPTVLDALVSFVDIESLRYTCTILDTEVLADHLWRLVMLWLRAEPNPSWTLKDHTPVPNSEARRISRALMRPLRDENEAAASSAVVVTRRGGGGRQASRGRFEGQTLRTIRLRLGMRDFVSRLDHAGSRRLVTLMATYEFLHHRFTFLSVLGGAYSALGRNSSKHVRCLPDPFHPFFFFLDTTCLSMTGAEGWHARQGDGIACQAARGRSHAAQVRDLLL